MDSLVPETETSKRREMALKRHRHVRMGVVDARKRLTKAMADAMVSPHLPCQLTRYVIINNTSQLGPLAG